MDLSAMNSTADAVRECFQRACMDQQTAPAVPRMLAATGLSIDLT